MAAAVDVFELLMLTGEPGDLLEVIPPAPAWQRDAVCAGDDGQVDEAFFPEHGHRPYAALELCSWCPVQQPCLEEALANDEYGVWGGTTRAQRQQILRDRRRAGQHRAA